MSSYLFVVRERAKNQSEIESIKADSQKEIAQTKEFAESLKNWALDKSTRSDFFKQSLGYFDDNLDKTKPAVKFVRMPGHLGGMQLHGLPFTWQWRIYLPDPDEFEFCWATGDIPLEKDSFDLPETSINRLHLPAGKENGMAGKMNMPSASEPKDGKKTKSEPVEILVFFRIDADDNGGEVFVNFEIGPVTTEKSFMWSPMYHGSYGKISLDDSRWLLEPGVSSMRGGYDISGFGVDRSHTKFPLQDGSVSLDEPTLLLKARAQKKLDKMKYESYDGPSPGLLIWIQNRKPEP